VRFWDGPVASPHKTIPELQGKWRDARETGAILVEVKKIKILSDIQQQIRAEASAA
jgi:hypothetical protein